MKQIHKDSVPTITNRYRKRDYDLVSHTLLLNSDEGITPETSNKVNQLPDYENLFKFLLTSIPVTPVTLMSNLASFLVISLLEWSQLKSVVFIED